MKSPHALLPKTPYATYERYLQAAGSGVVALGRKLGAEAVLRRVERSGLRGRGGAGFPTGTKWRTVREHPCPRRTVVCNAAEGEPGTFKDRWLLRRNPYAALEGMILAADVVGATDVYIAIKRSFTEEVDRLKRAVAELRDAGQFEGIEPRIVEGPEEYLFGEEKAALNVIEGLGPLPREAHYPPYERGLFGTEVSPNPALMNNVETFAHIPSIVRHGADAFRELGTPDTPGTILVTLSGDLARPGVYEVEAGTPLRELFFQHGGGPKPGRTFKAALAGVSAAPIGPDKFDTRADFGSLRMIGSGLGSAGFMLVDDRTSIPRVAQGLLRFLYVESCNQCTACKHGLRAASSALDELFDPDGAKPDALGRALYGARSAPQGNRCYLPVQAAALLPSLVGRFKAEFERTSPKSSRWPLPKILDFDEKRRDFVYDARQARKNPDWSYDEPARARQPISTPSSAPEGDVAVRLAPDLVQALRPLAKDKGIALDRQVDLALRHWLRGKKS